MFKKDPKGREYVEIIVNEVTKKSQGDDHNEVNDKSVMFAIPGSRKCPVETFRLFLSKLTDLEWLFQQPNPNYRLPMDPWFKRFPVGINKINDFLKEICQRAGVDYHYTNHCLRGTTINAMKKGGHDAIETTHVTHHKDPGSIKSYLSRPTLKQKHKYAKSLAKYTEQPSSSDSDSDNTNNHASDASDFDPPPPPKKKIKVLTKKKNKPTATISKPPNDDNNKENNNNDQQETDNQLVTIQEDVPNNPPNALAANTQNTNTTNNYLAMLKQNPVGMFMGANINNCTININLPK